MSTARRVTRKLASRPRRREPVDVGEASELKLTMENDSRLHPARQNIERALIKRKKNGTYDPAKAPKAFMWWVDLGAKQYKKEFGYPDYDRKSFNKPTRELVAEEFAREFETEYKLGNYG